MSVSESLQTDKQYPLKTVPWPVTCVVAFFIGLFGTGACLLATQMQHAMLAVILGAALAVFIAALSLIMQQVRPSVLTLRADGVYFPGRPKQGWRIGFSEIPFFSIVPDTGAYRTLCLFADTELYRSQFGRIAGIQHYWYVRERTLPDIRVFQEVSRLILSGVVSAWSPPGEGAMCCFLQLASFEQACGTTVTVEGTTRFPNRSLGVVPLNPQMNSIFNPSGSYFVIGRVSSGDRISVSVNGRADILTVPADPRRLLVLHVEPNNALRTSFLDELVLETRQEKAGGNR